MNNSDKHPSYLGFQLDWPVFVKVPFTSGGRNWTKGQEYKWAELGFDQAAVARLYDSNFIHHNPTLEKQNKTGDRLHEMSPAQLHSLVTQLNAELKSRTVSQKDYDKNRCRQSKIAAKQRGLIRRWLYSNQWSEQVYYDLRDKILGETPEGIATDG
jgi:hypothetical protein